MQELACVADALNLLYTDYRNGLDKCVGPAATQSNRNADLNLTLVTGTTNVFSFQIINSLIESWGIRLTCLVKCHRFIVLWGNINQLY